MEFLPYTMWHVLWDYDSNSPSGSTLQSDTWLWDDMPLNSPKRPPYWNSSSGFDFDHHQPQSTCHSAPLRNFVQIGPPSSEKSDIMSIFKMADLRHLGIYGFFKIPCTTSYRSSRHHSSKLLSFWENRVFADRLTNRWSTVQTRCMKPLSLSRAAAW